MKKGTTHAIALCALVLGCITSTLHYAMLDDTELPGYDRQTYHYLVQELTEYNRDKTIQFIRQHQLLSQLNLTLERKETIRALLLSFTKDSNTPDETKKIKLDCLTDQLYGALYDIQGKSRQKISFDHYLAHTNKHSSAASLETVAQTIVDEFSLLPE